MTLGTFAALAQEETQAYVSFNVQFKDGGYVIVPDDEGYNGRVCMGGEGCCMSGEGVTCTELDGDGKCLSGVMCVPLMQGNVQKDGENIFLSEQWNTLFANRETGSVMDIETGEDSFALLLPGGKRPWTFIWTPCFPPAPIRMAGAAPAGRL